MVSRATSEANEIRRHRANMLAQGQHVRRGRQCPQGEAICPQGGAKTKYARIRGHISCFRRRTPVTLSVAGRLRPGEIVTFLPSR